MSGIKRHIEGNFGLHVNFWHTRCTIIQCSPINPGDAWQGSWTHSTETCFIPWKCVLYEPPININFPGLLLSTTKFEILMVFIGFCKSQSSPTSPSLPWSAVCYLRAMACCQMGWRDPSRSIGTNVGRLGSQSLASLLHQWTCTNFGWELCYVAALDCGKQADGSWSLFGQSTHGLNTFF